MTTALQPYNAKKVINNDNNNERFGGTKRPREPENEGAAATLDEIIERAGSKILASNMPAEGASGPMSYVGLIPRTTSAPAAKQSRRIKTFHDVATQQDAAAAVHVPLSQTDWLPPVMAAPKAQGAVNVAQRAAGVETTSLQPSSVAPVDWTLKQSLRFTSTAPFTVWQEARAAPRSDVIKAERCFSSCGDAAALSLQQRLLAASMTWQFPGDPQPPASSRPATIPAAVSAATARRLADWQEALCSAYDAFRSGHCDTFYVAAPQLPSGNARKPTTAMFCAAGVNSRRRVHAVLTRSTPGLRAVLTQQGVGFSTPLMGPTNAAGASLASINALSAGATVSEGTRSMLVFEGTLRVHALFDFLLNRGKSLHEDAADVPVIMAPAQFARASLHRFNLAASSGTGTRTTARDAGTKAPAAKSAAAATLYQLDVKSDGAVPLPVPAWVADRLLSVLSVTQGTGGLVMSCEPVMDTLALNWQDPAGYAPGENVGGELEDTSARQRGWTSAEEASRWRRAVPGLDVAAVRELKLHQGVYTATKMTSRIVAAS